jgi:hypothetical protein
MRIERTKGDIRLVLWGKTSPMDKIWRKSGQIDRPLLSSINAEVYRGEEKISAQARTGLSANLPEPLVEKAGDYLIDQVADHAARGSLDALLTSFAMVDENWVKNGGPQL